MQPQLLVLPGVDPKCVHKNNSQLHKRESCSVCVCLGGRLGDSEKSEEGAECRNGTRTGYNWVKLSNGNEMRGNRRNSIIHKEGKRGFRL